MSKKLQLTITEPCHENWDNMTQVEKGKFCDSCQKQVMDFTNMSDRQIAEFFKKPLTGSVCGRFMTDQLDRDIIIPKKRIPWFKYFFSILLPAIFISKASAQRMGKVSRPAVRDTTRIPVGQEIRTLGMVVPDITPVCKDTIPVYDLGVVGEVSYKEPVKVTRIAVKGRVVDEQGNPIPGVSIRIVHSGKMIMGDDAGKFAFHSTKDQLIELELTSVGYATEHYVYPFTLQYSSIVDITVQMKVKAKEIDEVIVTSYAMGGVKRVMMGDISVVPECSLETKPTMDTTRLMPLVTPTDPIAFRVFPNPVTKGSTINLSFKRLEEGYYTIQILGVGGNLVNQRVVWVDAEATVLNMEAPRVAAGTYFLVMTNKKTGKKMTEKIIFE